MEIFYFRRIPESSVCVLWNKPLLTGGFCDDESNITLLALMGLCLVATLLGFYDYLGTVLAPNNFRACYPPKLKYTDKNSINAMLCGEVSSWHRSLKSCNFAEMHKACEKSAFAAPFPWLLKSKEEPNLDNFFFIINFQ